jgi:uracil-DNA glycosylase family protein
VAEGAPELTAPSAAERRIPDRPGLRNLREAAAGCRACPLWKTGTQTVFGAGRRSAKVMLVGEQPGDREDREGKPFVGPAGRVLDRALQDAGIDRDDAYVTNVVKHFKWIPKGKRRIHQKPNREEITACRPWLEAELQVVKPKVMVCLGATAAKALLGADFRVTQDRGRLVETDLAPIATGTVHPSSILRIDDEDERRVARDELADDLREVAKRLRRL